MSDVPIPVAEHHVDWISHAPGMHLAAGFENEGLAIAELRPADETP